MRSKAALLVAVVIVCLPLLSAEIPPDVTNPVSPAFDIQISIQPSNRDGYQLLRRPTPDTYSCTALVAAAGTRYAFGVAKLVAAPGRPESTSRLIGLDYRLKFDVTVNAAGDQANAVAEVSRNGKILTRQSSNFLLPAPQKRVVPVQ